MMFPVPILFLESTMPTDPTLGPNAGTSWHGYTTVTTFDGLGGMISSRDLSGPITRTTYEATDPGIDSGPAPPDESPPDEPHIVG